MRKRSTGFASHPPTRNRSSTRTASKITLTRQIDAAPIISLVELILLLALISALAYFFLSMLGSGITSTTGDPGPPNMFDALYFSIVTITTLGYGDLRPVGVGRLVSSVEVIAGLVLVAITVSKLASDRTATYVRLLYSSDCERRLKDFQLDISERVRDLHGALRDHNHEFKRSSINAIGLISVNLSKYYAYQTKVGALGEEWARRNSLRIVRAIMKAAEEIGIAGKNPLISAAEKHSIDVAFLHIQRAVDTIASHQPSEEFDSAREQIANSLRSYSNYAESGKIRSAYSEITPYVLEQVKSLLPPNPRPINIHREIAAQLRISKKLALKTIAKLDAQDSDSPTGKQQ